MDAGRTGGGEELFALRRPALILGAISSVALLAGAFADTEQFFRSWLMAWVLLVMISVGGLAVLLIQYLTGGIWGVLMRRPAEAAASTIPIVGLGFIPVLIGMKSIYVWSHPEVLAHDALLQHKQAYLNPSFFTIRGIAFFALWSVIAMLIVRWGRGLDERHDPWVELRLRRLSGFGLLAIGLTLTFASVDWLMSLEPHWFSTMYGLSFVIGCLLSGWAVLTMVVVRLARSEPYSVVVEPTNFRDFGNLMLAFVMLWAYTAFSQFLLIWYGNIREETPYYLTRMHGGWGVIAVVLLMFHFFLPFTLLLMRPIKDRPATLGTVAGLVLLMRVIDVFWIAAPAWLGGHGGEAAASHPAVHGAPFHVSWMDPAAFIALLALWFVLFLGSLRKRALLPLYEPHVKEALSHAG
ncbi:MAG TPA: hypothetical protein VMS56_01400 [Thermoanaerobaculia bacterium]|nr:hypothetical protein [Thermoanaerobaculia bacterium]